MRLFRIIVKRHLQSSQSMMVAVQVIRSSMWCKCGEKLEYEVQKCINFAAKVASNRKYFKRDHVTPLLRDLKWINFNSILRINETSFMNKNLYVSADSNVKKIKLRPPKQGITENN